MTVRALIHFLAVAVLAAVLAGTASAASADLPDGDEVARRINARDEGVAVSRNARMEMTDRHGKTRVQETRGFRVYVGEEKRTVLFYLSPKNVKDTAFLTFDYPEAGREDDQWLYLPALRKVRRISASNRGDYFLGTDFTYEDIKKETKVSMDDYRRRTLREDAVDGHPVIVVEALPVSEEVARELGYSRVVRWVDSDIWMSRKTELWDVRGNPLKTIVTTDIRQVQGIWTAHRFEVTNHKTGHSTILTFSDVDYAAEVDDELFTQQALLRGL